MADEILISETGYREVLMPISSGSGVCELTIEPTPEGTKFNGLKIKAYATHEVRLMEREALSYRKLLEHPEALTDEQCNEFRRLPVSFNDMVRAIYNAGRNSIP